MNLHKLDHSFCWISNYCLTFPYIVLNSLTISSLCAAVLFPNTLVTAASLVPRPFIAFLSWSASVSALKPLNGFNVPSYYKHRTGKEDHFFIYYLSLPVPDLITPIFFAIITHLCQDHKLVAKYIDEFLLNSNAFCWRDRLSTKSHRHSYLPASQITADPKLLWLDINQDL